MRTSLRISFPKSAVLVGTLSFSIWVVVQGFTPTPAGSVNHVETTPPPNITDNPNTPILEIDTQGHKGIIPNLIFTKDGRYLISSSLDKTVRVWDVETGKTLRTLRGQSGSGQEGKIFAMALSPDNRLLAVGGWMRKSGTGILGLIRLIDFQSGEVVHLLRGHESVVLGLAFSQDGRFMISGSIDKTARVWDVESGRTLYVLEGHTNDIYAVAFSPDGRRAVTGSYDHTLKLWDLSNGSLIATMGGITKSEGQIGRVRSAVFTPDGRFLLSGSIEKTFASGNSSSIRLWDGKTGRFIKILATQNTGILSLSISPDGTKVLTGSEADKPANNVYTIPSGERVASFNKNSDIVLATAISPDGRWAATGGGNHMEIYLWELSTGQVKRRMVGKGAAIWSVGFTRDGRSLSWGKTKTQNHIMNRGPLDRIFQLQDAEGKFDPTLGGRVTDESGFIRAIKSAGPWSIPPEVDYETISPRMYIQKEGRIIYNIYRYKASGFYHLSFTLAPDGSKVISGAGGGILTSYEVPTGGKLQDFIGHTGDVFSVAVSPDGRYLVSGSVDQTVRLWELATGKLLLTIFHGSDNEWVAWTPEGFYDASPNGDRYVGWRVNRGEDQPADYYTASQFSRYLHRPDIIRDTLTLSSTQEAIKKAGMERITIADLIQRAPVDVKIASVNVDADGKAEITVTLGKNKTTVPERITLYANGAQILSSQQRNLTGVQPGDSLKYTAVLPRKKNFIRVLVENQWAENSTETWVTNPSGKDQGRSKGTLFVHAIGVSRYQNMPPLYTPPLDAVTIAKRFKRLEGKLYEKVVVNLLTDENDSPVTTARIESLLNEQVLKAGPEDTTLIFLAGHGVTDAIGNYHFLTAESKVQYQEGGWVSEQPGTTFDWSRLHSVLDKILGRRLVFVDTCEAGRVLSVSHTNIRKLVKDIHDVNAIIYTGTSRQQEGLETSQGGVFTQTIISGMDGKAEYKEGDLLLTSLRNYVDREVPKRNREILDEMFGRGMLVVEKKVDASKKAPDFGRTQQPVAVIPKGMEYLVINRE